REIAAPRSVPPTPAKGSSTSSPDFVKYSMRRAISRGGLFAPWTFRRRCPSSDGYVVVQTDFVKYSQASPDSSLRALRGCGAAAATGVAGAAGAAAAAGVAPLDAWFGRPVAIARSVAVPGVDARAS